MHVAQRYGCGLARHDNPCVTKADKGDKQSDARRDGCAYLVRHGIYQLVAQSGDSEQNENQAFDEDSCQRKLPAVTHRQYDCINEEGEDTHSWCQCEGILGINTHEHGGDYGG